MIKNFEEYINEDYFSKLANRKDNGNVRKENEITEDFVRSFVYKGCEKHIKSITIRKENGKTIVDIDGDFYLKRDVEEIPFQFGTVTDNFNCNGCANLTSLKGCPQHVGDVFSCSGCVSLENLEGASKEVGGDFVCNGCNKITSLEGCPEKVAGDFDCHSCKNLVSLKGAPEEVETFYCDRCAKLESLEYCPKKVAGDFDASVCGGNFKINYVKSLCDVGGEIIL